MPVAHIHLLKGHSRAALRRILVDVSEAMWTRTFPAAHPVAPATISVIAAIIAWSCFFGRPSISTICTKGVSSSASAPSASASSAGTPPSPLR